MSYERQRSGTELNELISLQIIQRTLLLCNRYGEMRPHDESHETFEL